MAEETLGVIGAAMAGAGVVGLGPLTLSRRERMVAVEPHDGVDSVWRDDATSDAVAGC
ncbi:MAG: hypothetical protein JO032_03090 [Alphaproteobacteria bacterium]|nr:hypothetical protein [Alphaproteobacteria bacterium]